MPKYRVMQGLEYPPNRVVKAGEIVDDIPSRSVKWLREQGIIEPADANAVSLPEEPVVEETPAAVEPQAEAEAE